MIEKPVKIFGKNITLTLRNDGDFAIANELFLDHQYRFCDDVIKKTKNPLIDIGGHLGFYSLYASLLNPLVPIFSYEPHEGNFALLKENLKHNHIKNVNPKNLAVSGVIGPIELHLSKEDLNHSTARPVEPTGSIQKAQATTLERIFEKNRIEHCDLIKIDCEGAEFEILYATPQSIFDRTSNIFLEYHDWTPDQSSVELKSFLEKQGFKVQKYPNHKMRELGFLWCTKSTST